MRRVSDRWTAVNPDSAKASRVTTGGHCASNSSQGWNSRGSCRRRASPSPVVHRRAFNTSVWAAPSGVPTAIRYPTTPWSPGATPVDIEVRADAVVLGATVVIGPPARAARVGATAERDFNCSQPRPSRTSRRIRRDPSTSPGSHDGQPPGTRSPCSRAGTRAVTHAASYAGATGWASTSAGCTGRPYCRLHRQATTMGRHRWCREHRV